MVGIHSAADLGDVDGNGIGDFAIGAYNDDFDGERGRVVIMSGDTSYAVPVSDLKPETPKDFALKHIPTRSTRRSRFRWMCRCIRM
ncbi:MAG: FG-GAP repeat protein [bacterium]|nr:FG-GAP repeat protein [bacterium]